MIIRRMKASFGKLQNAQLSLGEGLNILSLPNEGGKSTWIAFLRAMFYGFDPKERNSKTALSDRNRYQPWSGAPMEGSLLCTVSGADLILERTSPRANAPMAQFSARRADTGEPMSEWTGETCGSLLLGVPREVFERSALVRQSRLTVDQSDELERRISSLISTGEESVSYSQVDSRLRDWRNKRRSNRATGELPRLDAELAAVDEKLDRLYRVNEQAGRERRSRSELTAKKAELTAGLAAWEQQESRQKWQQLLRAKTETDAAASAHRNAEQALDRQGPPPEKNALLELQQRFSRLAALEDGVQAARQAMEETAARLQSAEAKVSASPLAGKEADAVREAAQTDWRTAEVARSRSGSGRAAPLVWSAVLLVITAACFYFSAASVFPLWLPAAPLAVSIAGLMVLIRRGTARRHRDQAELDALLKKYGAEAPPQILEAAARYGEVCTAREERRSEADGAEAEWKRRCTQRESFEAALLASVNAFAPEAKNRNEAAAAVARSLELRETEEAAVRRLESARAVYEALRTTLDRLTPPPKEELPLPERSREELLFALSGADAELQRLDTSLAMTQGTLRAVGDPAALSAQREALAERQSALQREYDAISLAMDTLAEANEELQARFSPALNEETGRVLSELTGGRYQKVSLDRNFDALAEEAGASVSRRALSLSQGTWDQLYLAARIAVCRLALPAENPPPLLLDDALCNFDDDRMAFALELLLREAERRQIVLFTCHEREAFYFKGNPRVTVVSRKELSEK